MELYYLRIGILVRYISLFFHFGSTEANVIAAGNGSSINHFFFAFGIAKES
jgi:hypothetical protein